MTEQASTRRRFRFRLSTVLLLVTIVALGVAQVVATRRVLVVEAVNQRSHSGGLVSKEVPKNTDGVMVWIDRVP